MFIENVRWEFERQTTREEELMQKDIEIDPFDSLAEYKNGKKYEKFQNNWKLSNSSPSNKIWKKHEMRRKIRKICGNWPQEHLK